MVHLDESSQMVEFSIKLQNSVPIDKALCWEKLRESRSTFIASEIKDE